MQKYEIEVDALAVGLTRPSMFMGVSIKAFFANLVLCTMLSVDLHTVMGIPLFIILHCVMLRISVKEPNFYLIWVKVISKTPPVLNSWYWGKVNSYEPW